MSNNTQHRAARVQVRAEEARAIKAACIGISIISINNGPAINGLFPFVDDEGSSAATAYNVGRHLTRLWEKLERAGLLDDDPA